MAFEQPNHEFSWISFDLSVFSFNIEHNFPHDYIFESMQLKPSSVLNIPVVIFSWKGSIIIILFKEASKKNFLTPPQLSAFNRDVARPCMEGTYHTYLFEKVKCRVFIINSSTVNNSPQSLGDPWNAVFFSLFIKSFTMGLAQLNLTVEYFLHWDWPNWHELLHRVILSLPNSLTANLTDILNLNMYFIDKVRNTFFLSIFPIFCLTLPNSCNEICQPLIWPSLRNFPQLDGIP